MIDYSEFIASFVMNKFKDYQGYLREVFNTFDLNSDGQVTISEITLFFKKHTTLILEKDLKKLLETIDKDKSGTISMNELFEYINEVVEINLRAKLKDFEK